MGKLLVTLRDLDWPVKVMGNLSLPTFAPGVLKIAGPEAFANVYGQVYAGLSYCSGGALGTSEQAKFRDRLRAARPDADKLAILTASYAYDSTRLLLAAMQGSGSTAGPEIAAWITKNIGSFKATTAPLDIPAGTHFLFQPDALKLADHLNTPRSDGLFHRVGC